jgi:hypothetical protein
MSIEIKQKTVDLVFEIDEHGKLRGNVDQGNLKKYKPGEKLTDEEKEKAKTVKALRLHFSLMGETSPQLSPLAADFATSDKTTLYRYDWMVGATPFYPYYNPWDWFNAIGDERAMIVQLLIDTGKSGCGTSESNAFLLGLLPSKDTTSNVDPMLPKLGETFEKASAFVSPLSITAGAILKFGSVISSLVVSDEKDKTPYKNWFLYRFLDQTRECCAVEWNVSRNVLHQYGSVLRGSILLAFHGTPKPDVPIKLLLRPRLNFTNNTLDYDPPEEQLEDKDRVELEIKPLSAQG